MKHIGRAEIAQLVREGVILAGMPGMAHPTMAIDQAWKEDFTLATDAQPSLITQSNAGIPAMLTTLFDPEVVRTVVAPMRFAEVFGEEKKGSWLDDLVEFPGIESAGFVTSYGDWNNNGQTGVNVNWFPRQPYFYQTITQYGQREMEKYGLMRLNYVSELDIAAALVMNQYQNASYAFGVSGIQNYGVLNDPNLIAPITPNLKASGNYLWTGATQQEIFGDFLRLFTQLQTQTGGNIKQTDRLLVILSPGRMIQLSQISQYGLSAIASIKGAFPGIQFETIPEYTTAAGEYMQMILPTFRGTKTIYCAFPEKMRLFPVIPSLSGFAQKKAGGTWGAILRRPIAVASMLGI